jgi:hypothetical protein
MTHSPIRNLCVRRIEIGCSVQAFSNVLSRDVTDRTIQTDAVVALAEAPH